MIEKIFVIFGFVLFLENLFEKKNIWNWIQYHGSKSRFETIFKLATCRFCLMFHLSWMITFIYSLFDSFQWNDLVVPFVVSGLIQSVKKYDL